MEHDPIWAELRKRERICWVLLLAYVPVVAIIGFSLGRLVDSSVPFLLVAGAWACALLVAGNGVLSWPCPRCGQPFFSTRWYYNTFARRCVHCKLPKWALASPASASDTKSEGHPTKQ